ncbi:unnamed protein product [Meganyctiphanes norvegica]|uniref:AAA+ ATPase domain-containing protein n=1 Tax=Meganyctiphanes norvegica TaxID=48144 RepID=A0AAV2RQ83_MEGNR
MYKETEISTKSRRLFALEVYLTSLCNENFIESTGFIHYLKKYIVDHEILFKKDMLLNIQYLSRDITLKVSKINFHHPNDFVEYDDLVFQCFSSTIISVLFDSKQESNKKKKEISFDDIGGYGQEIRKLKKEIQWCVSFDKNSKSTNGILISGMSGCGKSLICEAISFYVQNFIRIEHEEVKSRFIGETENKIKDIFEKATKRAPCVILIDDIDQLCGGRNKSGNTSVVTTLLHLMDGVDAAVSEGVLVIATAKEPQVLDDALRRPGRLSTDITLCTPTEVDRYEIFDKFIARVNGSVTKEEITTLVSMSPGYVGGDIYSVMVEAINLAEENPVNFLNLKSALASIKPRRHFDSHSNSSKISLDDICGYEDVKNKIQEAFQLTLEHGDVFDHCGISPPTRLLLFGPPGCGKSSIVMATAAKFHLAVFTVKRSSVFGKYFGESEQNLSKIFKSAREAAPCVLLFENFDGLVSGRKVGGKGSLDVEERIINHLKVQLDGILKNDRIFIVAETTRPDLLDKDVIRPGRFHEYLLISLPTEKDRMILLRKHLTTETWGNSIDKLVNISAGYTMAELVQLCNELQVSLEEKLMYLSEENGNSVDICIINDIIEEVMDNVVPNTSQRMLTKFSTFAKTYCSDGLL